MLAAVRAINRVVCVGETMRAALNTLAEVAPEWLRSFAPDEWYERYEHRVEEYRLPKEQTKRTALVETIGADGYLLVNYGRLGLHLMTWNEWLALEGTKVPQNWRGRRRQYNMFGRCLTLWPH